MFPTNLSIIIITGTDAGHEPQNKSPRPEELSSAVLWLGLDPRMDWSAHRIGATRMVFLQPTTGAIIYSPHKYTGFVPVDGTR